MAIRHFADKHTATLFEDRVCDRDWRAFENVATRKLDMIDAAGQIDDLRHLSGNRLEKLKGDGAGQRSVGINDQFRVCFIWEDGDARNVESTDYHRG
ncbi:MAG: type II toxin-antitoxin system RelE/ParE family toxin [Rhizobiaceae bacterium]